ncbi:MAG: ribosome-associated translation inhibitor RaiA [Patescibacteria group bacterium]
MKINIKATGISLTPSISEYVEKKVSMLEKFFSGVDDVLINVEVGKTTKHHKSGDFFRAEIRVVVNGQTYYAVSETENLYASIDKVKDEIVHEMTSKRKKAMRLFRRGGAKIKELLKSWKSSK